MKIFVKIILITIIGLAPKVSFGQKTIYVKHDAIGNNTGTSWADAYIDLQNAVAEAGAGDSIWVARGTYFPTQDSDRTLSFELKSNVVLLGGFMGNETSPAERNIHQYPTILSGNIGDPADSTDNSTTILYLQSPDSATIVDGFVFEGGHAGDSVSLNLNARDVAGGAIYMDGNNSIAYAIVRNCIFRKNHALTYGGAVYIGGMGMGSVAPQFLDCVFEENSCRSSGGAIYRLGSSWAERTPDFGNCDFIRNHAQVNAGAIFWRDAEREDTMQVVGCRFIENSAEFGTGGAMRFDQGRIDGSALVFKDLYFEDNRLINPANITIAATELFTNVNDILSGTDYVELERISLKNESDNPSFRFFLFPSIENDYLTMKIHDFKVDSTPSNRVLLAECTEFDISDVNVEKFEGKFVFNLEHIALLKGKSIIKNIYFSNSNGELITTDFVELDLPDSITLNFANVNANNILCDKLIDVRRSNTQNIYRAAISNSLFNNIKYKERINSGSAFDTSYLKFINSSFFNIKHEKDRQNIDYIHCAFDTLNFGYNHGVIDVTIDSATLIGIDPLFLDTAAQNFRLHPCSPLINAGTNQPILDLGITTDLDGQPRIQDGTVDIGPYESSYAIGLPMGAPQFTAACHGLAEGSVTLAAEGGCPPYAVQWTNLDDGTTGNDTTQLLAGDYTFTLTDARGRTVELPLTLPGSSPELTLLGDSTACATFPNAFLEAEVDNAAQPIDYQWNTGATTATLNGLGAGAYSLSITDAYGCKDMASATVTATPPVALTATVQDASGQSVADGSIHLAINSGYPPYDFLWETGATTDSLGGLLPGNYAVTITDGNSCGYVFSFNVLFTSAAPEVASETVKNEVFPNPVRSASPITLRYADADLWALTDASGRTVCSMKLQLRASGAVEAGASSYRELQVELPCLASGVYFWSFSRRGRSVSAGRLVVE